MLLPARWLRTVATNTLAAQAMVTFTVVAFSTLSAEGQISAEAMKRFQRRIATKQVVAQSAAKIDAPPTPAIPSPVALAAGVPYHVKLDPEAEATATQIVAQHLFPFTAGGNVTMFPGVERQLTAPGGTEVQLKAFVLAGQPLTFDESEGAYLGTIRLGVTSVTGEPVAALSAPVQFEVVESNVAEPSRLELTRSSPPMGTMKIRWPDAKAPVTLHVASRFNPDGQPVSLSVSPRLIVNVDRARIQGYGLETCRVHVEAVGVEKPAGIVATLRVEPSAHLDNAELVLSAEGMGDTVVRSDGTGKVRIIASAAGLSQGSTSLDFDAPWRTVLSAIIGGLLGGLVRVLPSLARRTSMARAALTLAVAVIVGLLVFGLCVVGVNTLLIDYKVRVSDVFVLVASAMGAWVGTLALPRVPGKS